MSKTASKGEWHTELMCDGDAAAKTNESAYHILTGLTYGDIKVDELDSNDTKTVDDDIASLEQSIKLNQVPEI